TARRSRYFIVRYMCLLTLVGLLFFVQWVNGFGNSKNYEATTSEAQTMTQIYFFVFVIVQSLFVLSLTPAYVAGSIADEKERKTLEFILATDLQNREIVFGK